MEGAGAATPVDGWGEPLPPQRPDARPRRKRWWLLGVLGVVVALGAAGWLGRRALIASLEEACQEALRANDYQQLDRLAARWHWWQPAKAAPLVYQAEAASQQQQYERAVELLDRLPDADPMTPRALVERSSMLFGPLNRPIEGAETLERALKLDPTLVEARRRLVYFYAFTLQRRKMVEHVYEAIRNHCDVPETYVYLVAQDWLSFANAYAENTKWLRGNPDQELFMVARAIYRINAKSLDTAGDPNLDGPADASGVPYHRRVVADYFRRFPHNMELIAYHLELASVNGNVEEVARLLAQAPAEAAHDNRFWRYKGWLHGARGELEEADAAYRKALALNCYDFVSRHQLSSIERRRKRLDQVKPLVDLAQRGKELRRDILVMDSVATVPRGILQRVARYAEECGDELTARQLTMRLDEWSLPDTGPRSVAAGPRILFFDQ